MASSMGSADPGSHFSSTHVDAVGAPVILPSPHMGRGRLADDLSLDVAGGIMDLGL